MLCAGWPESSTFKVNARRPRLGGASGEEAFRGKRDSFGEITACHTPDIGQNAARGMKKHVEFHACIEWGQRFVDHGEWGSLRGKRTAETNQERNPTNDFGEIHRSSFDFTLGTA